MIIIIYIIPMVSQGVHEAIYMAMHTLVAMIHLKAVAQTIWSDDNMEFIIKSCIRDHHVSKNFLDIGLNAGEEQCILSAQGRQSK